VLEETAWSYVGFSYPWPELLSVFGHDRVVSKTDALGKFLGSLPVCTCGRSVEH